MSYSAPISPGVDFDLGDDIVQTNDLVFDLGLDSGVPNLARIRSRQGQSAIGTLYQGIAADFVTSQAQSAEIKCSQTVFFDGFSSQGQSAILKCPTDYEGLLMHMGDDVTSLNSGILGNLITYED